MGCGLTFVRGFVFFKAGRIAGDAVGEVGEIRSVSTSTLLFSCANWCFSHSTSVPRWLRYGNSRSLIFILNLLQEHPLRQPDAFLHGFPVGRSPVSLEHRFRIPLSGGRPDGMDDALERSRSAIDHLRPVDVGNFSGHWPSQVRR